jgi:hypothetical protein
MAKDPRVKAVGIAFTAKARKQKALQTVVTQTGTDPEHLEYVEDQGSKTAKVVDKRDGKSKGRFAW